MAKTYRAAIIGLGGFSQVHARAYSLQSNVELVAGCDIIPGKYRDWSKRVGSFVATDKMRFYEDAAQMLAAEKPDVVSITTKHDQHAPLTILCANAGVPSIICEKPIAMNLGEADAMIAACRKNGAALSIGHQRRFNQEWKAVKKLIEKGGIGQVVQAVSRWPGDDASIYRYEIFGGGPLMWLSVHSIDLLRWILGDVKWVLGQVDMGQPGVDCESRAYGLVEFASGARAVIDSGTGIGPSTTMGHGIVFYGDRGTAQVCDGHGLRYKTTRSPRWREAKLDKESLPWQVGIVLGVRDEIRDTIRAAGRGTDTVSSGAEARAALEVVMAIYESERTGGKVKLPLKKKTSPLLEMNKAGGFGQVTWTTWPEPNYDWAKGRL